ncbi:MAG: TetR family transcriptional regulator [Rhizobiales bacterium]|nr:TetR family transcriptional regulator [Hyphomicrobiales bacterium]
MRHRSGKPAKTTRDRILDAALKLVARRGIAGATTKRIADEAGVAEGSLYKHFADKPDLLIALVLERLPSIREVFGKLDDPSSERAPAERLSAALIGMIDFYAQAQPIMAGISSDPDLLRLCRQRFSDTDQGPHRAHEKLAEFIRQGHGRGRVRQGASPDVLASLLIGACTEFALLARLTGKTPGDMNKADYAKVVVATLSPLLGRKRTAAGRN